MKNDEDKKPEEIISLNQELTSFDINEVSLENLETRLEMALMAVHPNAWCSIDSCSCLACSSMSCGSFSCPVLEGS